MTVIDTFTDLPWAPNPNELTVHLHVPAPLDVPVTAVVILVRDGAGDILLTHVDSRGWDLPGGHVEAGEEPLDAAIRELLEETGLAVVDPTALTPIGYQDLVVAGEKPAGYPYPHPRSIQVLYRLDVPQTAPTVAPQPDTECSDAQWVNPDAATAHLATKTWRSVINATASR